MRRALTAIFLIVTAAFLMTGCTTVRLVDSDVTAFSRWSVAPPGPGTPYRFERLSSQQVMGTQQDQLEALARAALARVGMELNPATARLSVQVMFNAQIVERWPSGSGWYDGFGFPMSGLFLEGGSRGAALDLSFPMRFSEPYYRRELSILMRDLGSGELVFETRAAHDGVWSDTLAVLPAMLDAALLGFPQPMSGTRRVNIEIPR